MSSSKRHDPGASDASIRSAIAGWRLPWDLTGNELLSPTAAIVATNPLLGTAFADPNKSGLFVSELRKADPFARAVVPSLLGSSLAVQFARPPIASLDLAAIGIGPSMARNIAAMGERVAVVTEALRGPGQRLADVLRGAQMAIDSWRPYFEAFGETMQQLAEEQRELDEQTDVFVARHGWPVPVSLPQRAYKRVVAKADAGKREVNGFMVGSFRPGTRPYSLVREVLDESPDLSSRRPLLRQVYAAQRRGHWYLVINGLLPLVEGVLIDATFPSGQRPRTIKPGVDRLAENEPGYGESGFRALETMILGAGGGLALFESWAPPPGVEPRALNRNAVLHGSARRYGTELNATKLFLLIVLLAECLAIRRHIDQR